MNDMKVPMSYKNDATEVNECHSEPPLCALMDETNCMAGDASNSVFRINQHLFGIAEPKAGEMPEIKCFQDVLVRQAATLKMLNEALYCLMSKLGV